jgi:hypothetical protein
MYLSASTPGKASEQTGKVASAEFHGTALAGEELYCLVGLSSGIVQLC